MFSRLGLLLAAALMLLLVVVAGPAAAQTTDYDADDDGLIDVANAAQLSALRHDLDGNGDATHADYASAFPGRDTTPATRMGCPSGTCTGYELTGNITLTGNWTPTGAYAATFDGNGHRISGLTISVTSGNAGLFGDLGAAGVIRDVGIISPSISNSSADDTGALVGESANGSRISGSYVSGGAVAGSGASAVVGGLVGYAYGAVRASYSTATVSATGASSIAGGLVGLLNSDTIVASYAAGPVSGSGTVGGLIGRAFALTAGSTTVTNSYCDTMATGQTSCIGSRNSQATSDGIAAAGYTTAQLQNPTTYTGIYANWNLDLSVPADSVLDDPWYFGATYQYPQSSHLEPTAPAVDYDADDDDLIDVGSLAQLHAIRHDLNGDGDPATGEDDPYLAGFPGRETAAAGRMGCPNTCAGYELTADLTFPAAGPLASWTPLGTYTAAFDGRGHSIRGLNITASSGDAGLFATLGANGVIRNVGLLNPVVANSGTAQNTGALAGQILAGGGIDTSYVSGGRVAVSGLGARGGGLAGLSSGRIRASYSTAAVTHSGNPNSLSLGGLVGYHASAEIIASYAAGPVTPGAGSNLNAGGLVGASEGQSDTLTNSYCDTGATQRTACIGAYVSGSTATAAAISTASLQRFTGYESIYANWNIDLSDPADGVGDDPWDFGTERHYPLLKVDKDGDGRATCREFSGQPCYRAPAPPPYNPAHDHPEIYTNPRHQMATSCAVQTTGEGDAAQTTSTLTFNLGDYTRPITLALSLWDGTHFRSLQSQNISMPELRQDGQTATVEVVTDPAQTRFRLDSEYGLNLVLGYADCHTDDPEE